MVFRLSLSAPAPIDVADARFAAYREACQVENQAFWDMIRAERLTLATDGLRYFAREGFDYVLLPPGNRFTGEAYPLNVLLMRDAGWRLAYSDGAGFLFASRAAAASDR